MSLAKESCTFSEGTFVLAPSEYKKIRINKWRVREGLPVCMNQVMFLYEIPASDEVADAAQATTGKPPKVIYKYKAQRTGVVKKRLFKDGAIVDGG